MYSGESPKKNRDASNNPVIFAGIKWKINMATVLKAYYNGSVFVPMKPVDIQTGQIFRLSISSESTPPADTTKRLAAFRQITGNLRKINGTEPLPAEFDEILSQRICFHEINL